MDRLDLRRRRREGEGSEDLGKNLDRDCGVTLTKIIKRIIKLGKTRKMTKSKN